MYLLPEISLLMELITATTVILLSSTICLVLAVTHLHWPVLSCRSVSFAESTSTTWTGSPRLLIGLGELHTYQTHLLFFYTFAPWMEGLLFIVFHDLFSRNLVGGGGIISSLCHHLCLPEGGSTLTHLILTGHCPDLCRIDGMPSTLRTKCHGDQLGFS